MRTTFRGYDKKETDRFIEQQKSDYEAQIARLREELNAAIADNEKYRARIAELEHASKSVSDVLIDAVKRAQDIENDYKERARRSDEHYKQISEQWKDRINGCRDGIGEMKLAAQEAYNDIMERITQFEAWSSERLLAADPAVSLPADNGTADGLLNGAAEQNAASDAAIDSDALQREILQSVNLDLSAVCGELGLNSNDSADAENSVPDADKNSAYRAGESCNASDNSGGCNDNDCGGKTDGFKADDI